MRRNVTNKEVENNVNYLLNNMGGGSASLKTFTYIGSGEDLEVNIPSDCNIILCISGRGTQEGLDIDCGTSTIPIDCKGVLNAYYIMYNNGALEDGSVDNMHIFSTTENKMIITSQYDNMLNSDGFEYTVYYL